MHIGKGQVFELILDSGDRHARISCPPNLIPAPGQYLLASDGSDSPLPVPLFYTDSAPQGFIAAAPVPNTWNPGTKLHLRGPFGRGFILPLSARKVAIVVFEAAASRLKGLIQQGLKQDAAVVLVCDSAADDLPADVEVQPLSALGEVVEWADYVAFDVARENLSQLGERLGKQNQLLSGMRSQVLVRTAVPCGALAECGVCSVVLKSGWKLACKDGPVFDWRELL
jgi:NAD(P)H-flavin reductase